MKKFCLYITIWTIDVRNRESGVLVGQEFFLFYRQAERYLEKYRKEWEGWEEFEVALGGEPLWIW